MRNVHCLPLVVICLLAARMGWAELTLTARIEAELRAGKIDHQTALLYKAYSLFEPSRLPPEYREKVELRKSGTPIIVELKAGWEKLDESAQRLLAPYLARPARGFHCLSPGGKFRIHYDLSGKNAVEETDNDYNGIPDYIDQVAAVFDSCFVLEVETLGYQAPPSDRFEGGGPEYDVYVTDLSGKRVCGYTYPDRLLPSGSGCTSYIEIDNNYTDSVYWSTKGIDALRVTAAHEFFHAIQFSYYAGEDANWWREVCSTWMEDVAYDYVNDYYHYLSGFFNRPQTSLDTVDGKYEYGASVFAHYLAKRFGKDVIRRIWERIGQKGTASLSVFDEVIPGGMASAVEEFSLWNCYTGSRADTVRYYPEGAHYPEVAFQAVHKQYPAKGSGSVGHLAASYVGFKPQKEAVGGLRIDPHGSRGNWSFQVSCFPSEERPLTTTDVPAWNRYTQIVLILTQTSFKGGPFSYSYWAEFDPDLTGKEPLTAVLRQNWPNPFDIRETSKTTIPFDLASPADVILSIYSVNGQLVRREELGPLSPNSYHNLSWDGKDQQGRPVASGIYFYQIKANNFTDTRKMLLIK